MDNTTIASAKLLSLLLDKPISPKDNVSMESCEAWDSIKHIEIIVTFEDHFNIAFEPQDVPLLISQTLLTAKTRELLKG